VENNRTVFYFQNGPVVVFSRQEKLLQRVIELDRIASANEEPAITGQLRRLGVDRALAAAWINPRGMDAELEQKAGQASGLDALIQKTVLAYWKALDGIAVAASVTNGNLELGLVIQANEERLPLPVRKFVGKEAQPSELWRRFPANSLLVVAGRIDAVGLAEFSSSFLSGPTRQGLHDFIDRHARAVLGRDVFQDVLPNIGPDWGLCIAAPPLTQGEWFPHVIGALRIQPGNKEPPLDRFLFEAVNSLASLAVVAYNKSHTDQITLRVATQDKVEVRYFTNGSFPAGLQPAFAIKDGYLIVGSSPAAVGSFRRITDSPAAARATADEVPLLRLSFVEVRRFLRDRFDLLAMFLAEKNGVSKQTAADQIAGWLSALQCFEAIEVCHRFGPGQAALVLRVRTAQPGDKP